MGMESAPKAWTAEETETLRRLVEVDGISLRGAAPMLGREPHAVIAKARRAGIKSKHTQGGEAARDPNSGRAKRRERAAARQAQPTSKPQRAAPRIAKPRLRVNDPFAPLDGVAPIDFDDLESTSCRWPIERGTFCGAVAMPGAGPLGACYCPSHSAIARA